MKPTTDIRKIPELVFDENGNLKITASASSAVNDFDFYVGNWKIRNKKLKSRFDNCNEWLEFESTAKMYKILNGLGNIDNIYASFNGNPFEGLSVRFFNAESRLWSIHWADTNTLKLDTPTVGSFDNDFGHFFSQDTIDGKNVVIVYQWDIRDKENPVWRQAFSDDKGKNWEWNWYMYFAKAER